MCWLSWLIAQKFLKESKIKKRRVSALKRRAEELVDKIELVNGLELWKNTERLILKAKDILKKFLKIYIFCSNDRIATYFKEFLSESEKKSGRMVLLLIAK